LDRYQKANNTKFTQTATLTCEIPLRNSKVQVFVEPWEI